VTLAVKTMPKRVEVEEGPEEEGEGGPEEEGEGEERQVEHKRRALISSTQSSTSRNLPSN
jgi:hypothetical protein